MSGKNDNNLIVSKKRPHREYSIKNSVLTNNVQSSVLIWTRIFRIFDWGIKLNIREHRSEVQSSFLDLYYKIGNGVDAPLSTRDTLTTLFH